MLPEEIYNLKLKINDPKAHQNWSGLLNEKWLVSNANEDYYITKDGSLYKYSGTESKLLNAKDDLTAKLDTSYFNNLRKFFPENYTRSGYSLHSYQAIPSEYLSYTKQLLESNNQDTQLEKLNKLFQISQDGYHNFIIKFDAVLHEIDPEHNNEEQKITEYLANKYGLMLAYTDSGAYQFIKTNDAVQEFTPCNNVFADILFSQRKANFDNHYIESSLEEPTITEGGTVLGYSLSVEYNDRLVENCAIINPKHIKKIGADRDNVIMNELAHKNLKQIFKDADHTLGQNYNFFKESTFSKFIENNKQFNELMSDIASISCNEESAATRMLLGVARGINSKNYHASHTITKDSINSYFSNKGIEDNKVSNFWSNIKEWDFKNFKTKFNESALAQNHQLNFNEFVLLLEDKMLDIGKDIMNHIEKNYSDYLFLENL
ncbi:MAG: hypothetical protein HRT47_06445 [Candidatus Caenarcaniphilales bacterium]|nr:hypothetical protein [Candidatus Caenarcaniphilales bacterium]